MRARSRLLLAAAIAFLAPAARAAPDDEIRGADVSTLPRAEALGARFLRADGAPDDALRILREHGVNLIRLRVFVDSPDGQHGAATILPLARRAHALGLRLALTFHYSDTWADPAHQQKPAAWSTFPVEELAVAVHAHTFALCHALAAQGTPAAFVQIGNEINDGLLWPEGRITGRAHGDDFAPLARLLRAGIDAARSAHADTRIALHLGSATQSKLLHWWFDGVRAAGINWDYSGVSYYPHLHGSLEDAQAGLDVLAARYAKPVLMLETAYPFTLENADALANIVGPSSPLLAAYPPTAAGQAAFLHAAFTTVRRVPAGRGAGLLYWEPTWIATEGNGWDNRDPRSGNAWENQALFDFSGRALPALSAFLPASAPTPPAAP